VILLVAQLAASLAAPWQPVQPGVWHREMQMSKRGPLSVVRVIAVKVDPARVRFALDTATREYGTRGAWTVERVPADGLLAVNTGQFIGGVPWGWLVYEGVELTPPGTGSLAMSFVVDSDEDPALLTPGELPRARGRVRLAIQSYPALLVGDGALPWELLAPGRGADLYHRDTRLALGTLADGSIVIALTRFTGFGDGAGTLPWGPTVLEMAALMRSLGCERAVMLDGGISSQMALRGADGEVRRWTNWRKVPLGLVVSARTDPQPPIRTPSARSAPRSR
jgi:hypothetical protein